MTLFYWTVLFISAIAYGVPFLCESLWWFVFFFPIIFFYIALHNTLTFLHGYIWGIVSWTIHLGAPLYSVMLKANGPLIYKLAPTATLLLYLSLHTGIWFWATNLIMHSFYSIKNKKLNPMPDSTKLILWMCSIWSYLFFVSYWSLSLFNRVEGCFTMNPLILLAVYPPLLYLLPLLGPPILLFLLLTVSASITWFFKQRTVKSGLIIVATSTPWIFSIVAHNFHSPQSIKPPAWTAKVVHAPVLFCCPADTATRAHQMGREVARAQRCNEAVELIIFPESCLYGISDMQQLCSIIYEQYMLPEQNKEIQILCGGFCKQGTQWCNVFYWLHRGKVHASFCKRHTVLLAEALPTWSHFPHITDCYFSENMPEIAASNKSRPKFFMQLSDDSFTFIPYICSELFCNRYPDDPYGTQTYDAHNRYGTHSAMATQPPECIIEIANDAWATMDYTKRLMLYSAIFKAIAWQRNILYISYYYGAYINTQGTIFRLNK